MSRSRITRRKRNQRGLTFAEVAGALALFLPVVVLSVFVVIEATIAYQISRDLQIAASLAARALAESGGTTSSSQQSMILSNITVGNHVVDPSQFYAVQWNKGFTPPCVTVYVQYKSTGAQQPPPFPRPDPLKLGSQFILKSQATYRLQH